MTAPVVPNDQRWGKARDGSLFMGYLTDQEPDKVSFVTVDRPGWRTAARDVAKTELGTRSIERVAELRWVNLNGARVVASTWVPRKES